MRDVLLQAMLQEVQPTPPSVNPPFDTHDWEGLPHNLEFVGPSPPRDVLIVEPVLPFHDASLGSLLLDSLTNSRDVLPHRPRLRLEDELRSISGVVRGRLSTWTPENREHEDSFFQEVEVDTPSEST